MVALESLWKTAKPSSLFAGNDGADSWVQDYSGLALDVGQ